MVQPERFADEHAGAYLYAAQHGDRGQRAGAAATDHGAAVRAGRLLADAGHTANDARRSPH